MFLKWQLLFAGCNDWVSANCFVGPQYAVVMVVHTAMNVRCGRNRVDGRLRSTLRPWRTAKVCEQGLTLWSLGDLDAGIWIRQQFITWANVDLDLCHHVASLGQKNISPCILKELIFGLWGSIPCMLMPWLLKLPEHQQVWYWLCSTDNIYCCPRVNFTYLGRAKSKIWLKMWMYLL